SDDIPQDLANEMYEQVVNLGQGGHTRYLQRICNAFNYNKKAKAALFPDLQEDGALGNRTRAALRVLIEKRTTQAVLVHALNAAQAMHYVNLAARDETQRCFLDGWLTRTYDPESV
ncbi:MAG: putative peptidoglycan-binding domain-containing protein, partial [Bilophila wadsworthia]